jgi:putative membrane protein
VSAPAEGDRAGVVEEAADASRRTRLANERTYLAWWRTALTTFAVALGTGKLIPELADVPRWPYTALGMGFTILGLAFLAYGFRRHEQVERALARREYAPPDHRLLVGLTAAGVVLGLALAAVILAEG